MVKYELEEEKVRIPSQMMNKLLMLREEFDSIIETLDIMRNKALMEEIKRSREDVKKGRLISWKELQKRWKKEHAKV
jgi:PHD/YefM family antitoxin component YafN of YafNO toxin-antitoxin module